MMPDWVHYVLVILAIWASLAGLVVVVFLMVAIWRLATFFVEMGGDEQRKTWRRRLEILAVCMAFPPFTPFFVGVLVVKIIKDMKKARAKIIATGATMARIR